MKQIPTPGITLNELCREYGISRRAVQGYEKHGLAAPSGKTSRGYNLYDSEAAARILFVKQLQRFGFSLNEAGAYLASPPEDRKKMLKEKLAGLERLLDDTKIAIGEVKAMIEE